jgi:transcriptional regulator with AAA-type ATPase domain
MRFRLSGALNGKRLTFLLKEGEQTVGSAPDCDICLSEATISRSHALIVVTEGQVQVVDHASRNGTWIGTRRIKQRALLPGTTVIFGKVPMSLQEVGEDDTTIGVALDSEMTSPPAEACSGRRHVSTIGLQPIDVFITESLNALLDLIAAGADEARLAQRAGAELFSSLPALSVEIESIDEPDTLIYSAQRAEISSESPTRLEASGSRFRLLVELPRRSLAGALRPLVASVGAMMRIAAGSAPPPGPALPEEPPPLPDPPTVVDSVQRIYAQAATVARGDVGVLIRGESGTGKEVLARYLHAASGLDESRLVTLNCAALPNDLLEAELFGVERGVATGVEARPGKFELAAGGTIFLDEIADMSLATQAKILRVLQEGEVFRLGGSVPRQARCRVVAATNKDIDGMRAREEFREDLYYRIASWVVELPPLRHRRDDIPNLASHFLLKEARRRRIRVRGITRAALSALRSYRWPGNIRQLANEISRAALFLADGDSLEEASLSPEIACSRGALNVGFLEERLHQAERKEILEAFQRCGGVATAVAEELGIGRSTLYRRMKVLGIDDSA